MGLTLVSQVLIAAEQRGIQTGLRIQHWGSRLLDALGFREVSVAEAVTAGP